MDLLRTNTFKIVGKLVSQNLKTGNRKDNGAGFISGKAVVVSNLGGKDCEFEVSFFANQSTQNGKDNQLYVSYSKMSELIGKKVEITGDIRENRFYSARTNEMVSAQQLSGRFIRGVAETSADEGSFEVGGFVVESLKEKRNKNNEIYRYDLALGQSNYSGTNMSRLVFHINPSDVEIVKGVSAYQVGQTVSVYGDLRFYVETITTEKANEGGFGAPVVRTYVNRQHNYFITGGTAAIVAADKGMYPSDIIRNLVSAYKARDVELSSKAKESSAESAAVVKEEPKVSFRQTSLI